MYFQISRLGAAAFLFAASLQVHAAEQFQLRYNVVGSLGGEMFAPPDVTGFGAGAAATYIDIRKVTGNDGKALTMGVPGGTVPLPAPAPSQLYPTYGPSSATIDGTGSVRLVNFALGYITTDRFAGGRIAFGAVVPYGTKRQAFGFSATTPTLRWSPAVPQAVQSAVGAQFAAGYQAALGAQAASETGESTGLGDIELQGGWLYTTEQVRVLAGASIVLPTGRYDAAAGPDIGFGNFYTFRPAVQVAYLPTPDFSVAGKLTLGFNTRNRDNQLRSGNWAGAEMAVAYKTRVGAFGLHGVLVQQIQDDQNNPWGASRYRTVNAGPFFTTAIPAWGASITAQFIRTSTSKNAKAGDFSQVRILKVF